jgi:5-methylcytosine-specific restriction endonuclease McrA
MPSSPSYVRDLKQEYKTAKARGDIPRINARKRARRLMLKKGLVKPGQDVDHKKPLIKGGSNDTSNLRAASPSANRSFKRTKNAGMK